MRPLLLFRLLSFVCFLRCSFSLAMRSLGGLVSRSAVALVRLFGLIGGLALPSEGLRLVRAQRQ